MPKPSRFYDDRIVSHDLLMKKEEDYCRLVPGLFQLDKNRYAFRNEEITNLSLSINWKRNAKKRQHVSPGVQTKEKERKRPNHHFSWQQWMEHSLASKSVRIIRSICECLGSDFIDRCPKIHCCYRNAQKESDRLQKRQKQRIFDKALEKKEALMLLFSSTK